jgi:hypothetical protein
LKRAGSRNGGRTFNVLKISPRVPEPDVLQPGSGGGARLSVPSIHGEPAGRLASVAARGVNFLRGCFGVQAQQQARLRVTGNARYVRAAKAYPRLAMPVGSFCVLPNDLFARALPPQRRVPRHYASLTFGTDGFLPMGVVKREPEEWAENSLRMLQLDPTAEVRVVDLGSEGAFSANSTYWGRHAHAVWAVDPQNWQRVFAEIGARDGGRTRADPHAAGTCQDQLNVPFRSGVPMLSPALQALLQQEPAWILLVQVLAARGDVRGLRAIWRGERPKKPPLLI